MIYKYKGYQFETPRGSKLLKIVKIDYDLYSWVLLADSEQKQLVMIDYEGTGWEDSDTKGEYVDTLFEPDGYVWHYFVEYKNV